MPVIFLEEPEIGSWPGVTTPQLQDQPGSPGVRVVRPLIPATVIDTPGNSYREIFSRLWRSLVDEVDTKPIIWEYSPMMVYLVKLVNPRLVVYDCMDELANFRGASADLKMREAALMEMAEVVFTGGWSMYDARKHLHPNVHCFPSGVDVEHYRACIESGITPPQDVVELGGPRLGYFGVLDERLDWRLVDGVAAARPDWQWVFVGPTAKIDPQHLPRRANIHYLGQRAYNELPAYLSSFDVATMPFARNDATRFISPTKTLEYMAGHKPIVSTSIPDVVRSFATRVRLADDVPGFIEAVEKSLRETPACARQRVAAEDELVNSYSWDDIADRMWRIVEEQLMRQRSIGLEALDRTAVLKVA